MRQSLFPSDESVPTWLHTLLLFMIVSPFSLFCFFYGFNALSTERLEALNGPELGQYLFGNVALAGKSARIAGFALISLGFSFVALATQFSRLAIAEVVKRYFIPWFLLVIHITLSLWIKADS